MKTHRLITAFAVLGALSSFAAAPLRWDASIERPAPVDFAVYQGETIALTPLLLTYGAALSLTNATATLRWQTNGMGALWWSSPATVSTTEPGRISATWGPTNDVGASQYSFFFKVTLSDSSSVYRAFGTLTMRSSPGYAPTAAPPPAYQWVTPDDMQAASNALASAIQALAAASTAISNLVVAIPAQTNQGYVAHAGTSQVAVVADRLLTSATITLTNMIDEAAGNYEVCTISAAETRIKSYVASNLAENVVITKTGMRFALDSGGMEYGRTFMKYVSHDGDVYLGFPTESGTLATQEHVAEFGYVAADNPTYTQTVALASSAIQPGATSNIPAQIAAATNPIPSWITAATNPIPGQTAAAITAATNDLVTKTVTNGLATSASVVASTNPIPSWITASTNPIPGQTAAAITAATNGLVTKAVTNGLATSASVVAATNPIPSWIAAATNAIPRIPTNAISGWLLYDSGSNRWLRVSVSNYSYYISEVL